MAKYLSEQQISICKRFGAEPLPARPDLKVGVSRNLKDHPAPWNGMRNNIEGDTTGWYIWAGEWSDDPEFFVPLHVKHLAAWRPEVLPYLALPPGWRFLIAPGYEDVWFEDLNA